MFEPTTLPIAIEPASGPPRSASPTLTASSGALVPKATTVRPITTLDIPVRAASRAAPRTSASAPATSATSPAIRSATVPMLMASGGYDRNRSLTSRQASGALRGCGAPSSARYAVGAAELEIFVSPDLIGQRCDLDRLVVGVGGQSPVQMPPPHRCTRGSWPVRCDAPLPIGTDRPPCRVAAWRPAAPARQASPCAAASVCGRARASAASVGAGDRSPSCSRPRQLRSRRGRHRRAAGGPPRTRPCRPSACGGCGRPPRCSASSRRRSLVRRRGPRRRRSGTDRRRRRTGSRRGRRRGARSGRRTTRDRQEA